MRIRVSLFLLAFFITVVPAFAQDKLQVVATTTILADVARNIGGDLVDVTSLVPADADAHAYEPTTDDVARVAQADLVLAVGVGYETFLNGLLENVGESVPVVEVSVEVPILALGDDDHEIIGGYLDGTLECGTHEHEEGEAEAEHEHGECDPHVWMSPWNVSLWTFNLVTAFSELDPVNSETYAANASVYRIELNDLYEEIQDILSVVPEDRRILVTNHDFMGYFADEYGFQIVATVFPGSSTGAEIEPRELAALIEQIRAQNVPAIFAEVSANSQLAEVIAQEAGIEVVTSLYSESLGGEGSPASTYIDMMRYNATTIADALVS